MEKILEFLNKNMNKPQLYSTFKESWFFYMSLLLLVLGSIISIIKMKNLSEKKVNIVIFISSIILILFEAYKQLIFSYQADWSYQWFAFPFQFCSVGMYLGLILPFIKNKKIRISIITFLGTFSFFSGLAVMVYPATVFVSTIGVNIQTMVHHGLLSIIGIGLLVNQVPNNFKSFFGGMIVFTILVIIAMMLNGIHNKWILDGTFNMFFINPKFDNGLPILELIQPHVSPFVFILVYLLGFSIVSLIIFNAKVTISTIVTMKNSSFLKNLNIVPQN